MFLPWHQPFRGPPEAWADHTVWFYVHRLPKVAHWLMAKWRIKHLCVDDPTGTGRKPFTCVRLQGRHHLSQHCGFSECLLAASLWAQQQNPWNPMGQHMGFKATELPFYPTNCKRLVITLLFLKACWSNILSSCFPVHFFHPKSFQKSILLVEELLPLFREAYGRLEKGELGLLCYIVCGWSRRISCSHGCNGGRNISSQ